MVSASVCPKYTHFRPAISQKYTIFGLLQTQNTPIFAPLCDDVDDDNVNFSTVFADDDNDDNDDGDDDNDDHDEDVMMMMMIM